MKLPPSQATHAAHAAHVATSALSNRQHDQEALLCSSLRQLLGPIDPQALELLRAELQWVELPAGAVLMRQGEPGDAMFIAISGRLRADVCDDSGRLHHVRELARGQVIGEMSLYTDDPRSATVLALRDAVLVRLDKPSFQRLLATGGALAQALSNAMTRQLVQRLRQDGSRSSAAVARPITMSVLPASPGVDLRGFAIELAQALGKLRLAGQPARVRVVDAEAVDAALGQPGLAQQPLHEAPDGRRIALWLDHVEAQCDFMILLGDARSANAAQPLSAWSQRCSRHGDERLLLADASQPPQPMRPDSAKASAADLAHRPGTCDVLVLLHAAETTMPRNTAAWLDAHPGAEALHLRHGHVGDMARLARIQARQATGLVLAGGGARGLAHLGVWRALRERGIEIDIIGGTSIGAAMAATMAADQPLDKMLDITRRAFGANPTGDYNLLPMLSLMRGRRLKRVIDTAMEELAGPGRDAEDLWKPFYCIAANYSRACEQVVRRGPLAKMVRASLSIPGALPPVVVGGELLCDGGTFNNFPVDVMRSLRGVGGVGGEGRVIGVSLSLNRPRHFDFDEVPSPWALARDRLRGRDQRRYKLPSLTAYLMNVTVLYSNSRQQQASTLTDLHFNPPLQRVGMLQWHRFEQIVQQGYEHAVQVLDAAPP